MGIGVVLARFGKSSSLHMLEAVQYRVNEHVSDFCCFPQVISPVFNQLASDEKYKDNAIFVTVRRLLALMVWSTRVPDVFA